MTFLYLNLEDARLTLILHKIQNGEKLGREDALTIYHSHDLHGIAQLANFVREQRHGNRAWVRQDLQSPRKSSADLKAVIAELEGVGTQERYEPSLTPGLTGHTYLKHVAVARLLLSGVNHIEARLCPEVENVCQLALRFGADTLIGPDVTELERQVRAAGREMVLSS